MFFKIRVLFFSECVAPFVTVLSLTGQNKLNFTIIMYNSPSDLEKSENTYHRINGWGNLFKLLLLLMLPYRANRVEGVLEGVLCGPFPSATTNSAIKVNF